MFMQVSIGPEASTLPYALVTPETSVKAGGILAPLVNATDEGNQWLPAKLHGFVSRDIGGDVLSLGSATLVQVCFFSSRALHHDPPRELACLIA